jgi:mRNA interferase RelE/StbE
MPEALEEWHQLDNSIKELLRKALKKRLIQPHLPGSELYGDLRTCYKIKLRKQGYRLVYTVDDDRLLVLVLAIDKREDMAAYQSALARLVSQKGGT